MSKIEAIAWAGSASNLAGLLKVSRAAITQWTVVPDLRQWQLRAISEGKLEVDPHLLETIRQQ
jgi:DNA-binding transcriptional regulator YdaS (Cro superfamily)